MENSKQKILVIFGGQSTEHEISCMSAKNVISAIDTKKYEVIKIGITKKNKWFYVDFDLESLPTSVEGLPFVPDLEHEVYLSNSKENITKILFKNNRLSSKEFDIVFPILHGNNGEDGKLQGLLDFYRVPYIGCGLLSSALCMDKGMANEILKYSGINSGKYLIFNINQSDYISEKINKLKPPLYVKPLRGGSSVGISRVEDVKDIDKAIAYAFEFDSEIIIEEEIIGKEIECGVVELTNGELKVSLPGEIHISSKNNSFYDFDKKYLENVSEIFIPARVDNEVINEIQKLSLNIFKILKCEGFARIDFLINENEIVFNEINTIPGFTNISLFPKMFENSGIGYEQLVDLIIQTGLKKRLFL